MATNPFTKPEIPADLQEIIDTHRALFGGFTMVADEQQGEQAQGEPGAEQSDATDLGDAGKKALDTERKARREAERRAKAAEDELAKRDDSTKSDTERLTKAHTTEKQRADDAEARAATAERRLAVYLNAGDGDPAKLLKHTDFLAAIAEVDPTDTDAIKAAVSEAVKAEPWLKRTAISNGDTREGHTKAPENVAPGVPRLAAAFEQAAASR